MESPCRGKKVPRVEGDQSVDLSVQHRFKHQLVLRVLQLRAPQEVDLDRFCQPCQCIEEGIHAGRRQTMYVTDAIKFEYVLIFEPQ